MESARSLTGKAQELLSSHPIIKTILDGFFSQPADRKYLEQSALFIREHPTHGYTEKEKQAALLVQRRGLQLDEAQYRQCEETIYKALARTRRNEAFGKTFENLEQMLEQISQERCQQRLDFLDRIGISNQMPEPRFVEEVIEGCDTPLTLMRQSPAEELLFYLRRLRHLPMHDASLLQNPIQLLQWLRQNTPSLNASVLEMAEHTPSQTEFAEYSPQTSEAHNAPETDSMTEEEFILTHADQPDVLMEIGLGAHVEKIAQSRGISIIQAQR